ncbi:MAG: glucose-6-phosphate dehydrogenase, partial [Alicyclobacillus sp. RIFOXYA1_FULL_53_8]
MYTDEKLSEDGFEEGTPSSPLTLILFGATGDLAQRKLYSALYSLYLDGRLPSAFAVTGVARKALHRAEFQTLVQTSLERFSRHSVDTSESLTAFLEHFYYVSVDVKKAADFEHLRQFVVDLEANLSSPGNRMFYLAMAPEYFGPIALNLKSCGLTGTEGWKRLVIEKPFGTNLESAERLNSELRQGFQEEEIYRIDHYLGKEMVQNIEVLRFANSIFEPVWNNRSIANIQITSSETVGVEERSGYYDQAGAVRDMVQNHMLQMVMMIAMEPPSRLKTEAIRDEKVKVLRSLRRYQTSEIGDHVVLGQYEAGQVAGQEVPAYRDEPGVHPKSRTETFVAARLFIDNFRWAGVPFYIRTGKRLGVKATEIV